MKYSYTDHTGDGTTISFPFSFVGPAPAYLSPSHIKVYVNGVLRNHTLSGTNQVTITPAPASGTRVLIRRIVPKTTPFADFGRGNNFTGPLLNKSFLQQLYAYHEFLDGFVTEEEAWLVHTNINMSGKVLKNLGDGVDPKDSVNLAQVQRVAAGIAGKRYTQDTVPTDVNGPAYSGVTWFHTGELRTYTYFCDGDSCQWIEDQPSEGNFGDGYFQLDNISEVLSSSYPSGSIIRLKRYYPNGEILSGFELINRGQGWPVVADGKYSHSDNLGNYLEPIHSGILNVKFCGAKGVGSSFDDTAFIKSAKAALLTGVIYAPKGTYRVSDKLSFNESGLIFKGDGPDLTYMNFYDNPNSNYKTAIEINNGSWNELTNTYTSSGVSIGSSRIESMSIQSVNKTGCTGVVLARATKQCGIRNVKIVGWDVPYRAYGAWYSSFDYVSVESNVNGGRLGYETNDFTFLKCDHTSNSNSHLEFEDVGTCRRVQYLGGSFDGLPSLYGIYLKNVSSFSFRDVYFEIYDSDSNTSPFLQCGQNVININLDGIDLIFPTDNSYTGTAIKLGTGSGVGASGVGISNFRQYNSGFGTAVDCTNASEVYFGVNVKCSAAVIYQIGAGQAMPSQQSCVTFPALLHSEETTLPLGTTVRGASLKPRVSISFSSSADLNGRFFRVIRSDSGGVVINHPLSNVISGQEYEIGYISGVPEGVLLKGYTYKVGSNVDWPTMAVFVQQV